MNRSLRLVRLFALALVPFMDLACAKGTAPAPKGPDQTYRVRGEIARLPEGGSGAPEIWIRHEAIPDFTGEDGQRIGMDSMTMPFALDPAVSLQSIAVGDKVAFTLEVRWTDRAAPAKVVRLEKLPSETELVFGPPGK